MNYLYNVEKFDTIDSIAQKFNISVKTLVDFNNIAGDLPKVLNVPTEEKSINVMHNFKRNLLVEKDAYLNNVKNFARHGFVCAKVESLCLLSKNNQNIYVVKVLDTLNSVCNKLGLNKEYVKKINNLKSDHIFIGQMLKLE